MYLFIYAFICLFIYLFIYLLICLLFLAVCLSASMCPVWLSAFLPSCSPSVVSVLLSHPVVRLLSLCYLSLRHPSCPKSVRLSLSLCSVVALSFPHMFFCPSVYLSLRLTLTLWSSDTRFHSRSTSDIIFPVYSVC